MQKWMTKREVRAEYGISERTVDRLREQRLLTAYRIGRNGNIRFKRADVEALARPVASVGAR